MRLATSPEQDGCVTAHAAFPIPFLELLSLGKGEAK
jgi:hypothetical protein